MPKAGLAKEHYQLLNQGSADETTTNAAILRVQYAGNYYALAQIDRYDPQTDIYKLMNLAVQHAASGDRDTAGTLQDQIYTQAKTKFPLLEDRELIQLGLGPASSIFGD